MLYKTRIKSMVKYINFAYNPSNPYNISQVGSKYVPIYNNFLLNIYELLISTQIISYIQYYALQVIPSI